MGRKLAIDSIAAKIQQNSRPDLEYDVPLGLAPLSDPERSAWNDYIAAKSSWKAAELRTLYRLVKFESEMFRKWLEAGELESGDPLNKEVREVTKMVHTELRLLGFCLPANMKAAQAGEGKPAKQSKRGKKASVSMLK